MTIAICPGSFDPVTNGHIDILERASKLFEKVIIAVLQNPSKQPLFTIDERVGMLSQTIHHIKNSEIDTFNGLLIDYAKEKQATVIIRGLRAVSDFEYEFQMASMNQKLNKHMETIFMMTSIKYSYLRSSIIKEIASLGGLNIDGIKDLVPDVVYKMLQEKYVN